MVLIMCFCPPPPENKEQDKGDKDQEEGFSHIIWAL